MRSRFFEQLSIAICSQNSIVTTSANMSCEGTGSTSAKKEKSEEMSEEDKELQEELKLLVDKITDADQKLVPAALEMLRHTIRTSTTSMTSVPKPLKYLAPYYNKIKDNYPNIKDPHVKKQYADIVSVLAMSHTGGDNAKEQLDCLRFCLLGTMKHIGDWGHEYVRHLEMEIIEQFYLCSKSEETLQGLIKDIVAFDCKHHAEIQACDLLMEIDKLNMLPEFIDKGIYQRICLYLQSCAKYVDEVESEKIFKLVSEQYLRFEEYPKALIIGIQMNDSQLIKDIFTNCKDKCVLRQMAFIAARQLYPVDLPEKIPDRDELNNILNNTHLSTHFLNLARELDIMEPKTPEDVYKTWLEPTPIRPSMLGENVDSARQNLASSFVNGFVNAGFGCDKLLTQDSGNKWIYRNKDHGMFSATAALGLVHLWDVDGGLTPIDKYLYSKEDQIKAGALLALGIVNCRVKNECDPALALLAEYVQNKTYVLQIGAVLGLGLAYAGTARPDVIELILPAIENAVGAEQIAITCVACGLVAVGTCNSEVASAILSKLVDMRNSDTLKSPHMNLALLGLGLCYLGRKDSTDATYEAVEVFDEPFSSISKSILHMCAYAGTGDVLMIQELLLNCVEPVVMPEQPPKEETPKTDANKLDGGAKEKKKPKVEFIPAIAQATAVLGLGAVAAGEEMGQEMCHRLLGSIGRYGDPIVRRAVPLAVGLLSMSKPHLPVLDLLTKYSHDSDEKVSCNSIFALGLVGAGTNNARLAASLRQLAVYHARNPSQLFMVRIAQGLTFLGKGTLTLSPVHSDRQLVDPCAMAGILIPLVSLLDPHSMILGRTHYLMYTLATAIQPRWLLVLDEELQTISVPVRVGQAVDIVGKAGTPKTIVGIHTNNTPVLLASGERAELATDQYEQLSPILDGICIVKKKPEAEV